MIKRYPTEAEKLDSCLNIKGRIYANMSPMEKIARQFYPIEEFFADFYGVINKKTGDVYPPGQWKQGFSWLIPKKENSKNG